MFWDESSFSTEAHSTSYWEITGSSEVPNTVAAIVYKNSRRKHPSPSTGDGAVSNIITAANGNIATVAVTNVEVARNLTPLPRGRDGQRLSS